MKLTEADFQAMQGNATSIQKYTVDTSRFTREELLSYEVNKAFWEWCMADRFAGVYFHVANETQVPHMKPHQAKRFWDKRNAIGVKKGAPDWVVAWEGGCGFIELKAPATYKISEKTGRRIQDKPVGKLSPEQEEFKMLMDANKINHAVCYSVEDVLVALERWGALHA